MWYLHVTLLLGLFAGEWRAPGVIRVGMPHQQVRAALGAPSCMGAPGDGRSWEVYNSRDWAGGRTATCVDFGKDGRATAIEITYHPFDDRPTWLPRIWDLFGK
jgi:outer membrane protein assembly factor BamE (lipoprotein component of BamABCDE complex)